MFKAIEKSFCAIETKVTNFCNQRKFNLVKLK